VGDACGGGNESSGSVKCGELLEYDLKECGGAVKAAPHWFLIWPRDKAL